MKKPAPAAIKAYKNLSFLNSADARSIRILSEFLEPLSHFREEAVRNTIVFFGSARIKSFNEARKNIKQIKQNTLSKKKISNSLKKQIAIAKVDLQMSRYYEDAVKLSSMLTTWSKKFDGRHHFVICSGGGPGIMEAANKGAKLAGGKSIGLNISIPTEQKSNSYISPGLNFEFHYFFMRKFWFVYLAKGLVLFPGGFGTLDEFMEVLTLLQTKKIKKHICVILYGSKYWNQILNFKALLEFRTISEKDLRLFKFADRPEEAFYILTKDLRKHYFKNNQTN